MHRATPPPDLPAWDAPAMRDTAMATLLDWWWPAMFGAAAPDAARADFAAGAHRSACAGRRRPARFHPSRLLRRQPVLVAGSRRHPTRRRDRLPGRLDRPPRIRPGFPAAGCPPRHPPRDRRTRVRALPGRPTGARRPRLPHRLCRLRGATPSARRRPMGPPRATRQPPGLSGIRTAHLGAAERRPAPSGRGAAGRRHGPLDSARNRANPPDLAA